MKKIIINEDWQEEVIEATDSIFAVIIEDYTNNLYHIYADGTEEAYIRDAFAAVVNSLKDIEGESIHVSLVKLPYTTQTSDLITIASEKTTDRDTISEILGRIDCEVLDSFSTRLQEAKKKKKKGSLSPFSSMRVTMGDPAYDIAMFNKRMGTDFEDQAKQAAKEAEKAAAPAVDAAVDAGETSGSGDLGGTTASGESSSSGEASGGDSAGGDAGAGLGEAMEIKETIINEDDLYAHVNMSTINLPDEVKLLSQTEVEAFVKELEPGQLFEVGYITPFNLYSHLANNFKVLKATVFKGYTGIDYRDVSVGDEEEKAARLAKAKQDIIDHPDGAHG